MGPRGIHSSLSVHSLSLHIRPKSKRKERRVLSNSRSLVSYRHHQRQPCDAPSHTQLDHHQSSSCWSQKKPDDFKQQPPNCFYSLSNLITILMGNHPDRSGLRLTVTDGFPKVSRGLFAPHTISRRCQRPIHPSSLPEILFGNPKMRHPTGKIKIPSPALHGVRDPFTCTSHCLLLTCDRILNNSLISLILCRQ